MNTLLHSIIPHRGNRYKPHAISHVGLAIFALLIFTFQGIYSYHLTGDFRVLGYATNVSTSGLLASTNAERQANGLSSFQISSQLNQAAQAKAQHMIANDYWDHYAPDGTSPWYFIANAGYQYNRAGENLAFKFDSSSGVVTGWMNSPTHRANILDGGFSEVGFGIANGSNYQGDENTVVVAMYGEPFVEPTPEPPVVTQQAAPVVAEETTPTVAEEATDEPQQKPESIKTEVEKSPLESQRLLASLSESGQIVITGSIAGEPETVSNFDRLASGNAHWSLYLLSGTLLTLGAIYMIRHLQSIYQIIKHGEHYVAGHPTLEAGLIYAVIWVFIFTSYGVIL